MNERPIVETKDFVAFTLVMNTQTPTMNNNTTLNSIEPLALQGF